MKRKIRSVSIVLAFVLALSLCGCASSTTTASTSPPPPPATPSPVATPSPSTAPSPTPTAITQAITTGSTTGNIANLGIAALQDEWIYYMNGSDNGYLYKIRTDGTKKQS